MPRCADARAGGRSSAWLTPARAKISHAEDMSPSIKWVLNELERMERQLRDQAVADEAVAERLYLDMVSGVTIDAVGQQRRSRAYWTHRSRADSALRAADELLRIRRGDERLARSAAVR